MSRKGVKRKTKGRPNAIVKASFFDSKGESKTIDTPNTKTEAKSDDATPRSSVTSSPRPLDWHKVSTVGSLSLGLIAIAFSAVTLIHNLRSMAVVQQQLSLQQKTFERDLPIEFAVNYKLPPSKEAFKEYVVMENTGRVVIVETVAELRFYFVYADGTIRSQPEVELSLQKDPTLLAKGRETNFLTDSREIDNLLGGRRRFPISQLGPGEASVTDINASLNLNALRLGKLLGAEVIARWRIEYRDAISKRQGFSYAFIWIHDPKPSQLKDREEFTRENLSTVIGGKKIIAAILDREETSKEVMFGLASQEPGVEKRKTLRHQ